MNEYRRRGYFSGNEGEGRGYPWEVIAGEAIELRRGRRRIREFNLGLPFAEEVRLKLISSNGCLFWKLSGVEDWEELMELNQQENPEVPVVAFFEDEHVRLIGMGWELVFEGGVDKLNGKVLVKGRRYES